MVTVEADAFWGPLLARRAQEAGVVYSLAYGDQPVGGRLIPAADSLMTGALPLGLAHGWKRTQPVADRLLSLAQRAV